MANLTCPPPFLDASLYPLTQGYTGGRMCATIPLPGQVPGTHCCLPCPLQDWVLEESSLHALHVNDIINVIGIAVGSITLLSLVCLPKDVTHRTSLGISIIVAALFVNFCFVFPLHDLKSLQCANAITPANHLSNPICGIQGSLHVYMGHTLAMLVVCRTIYLHCQICWNIQVSKIPIIALNIFGWVVPAIFFGVVFAVSEITYTISNHCSIQVDWVINLLIIPLICEIGCSLVVQLVTFCYCLHIYMRSLKEPAPPTNESLPFSTLSHVSSRYPYRKALRRIKQVFHLQWRAWVQCLALVWTGTLFSVAYFILASKYLSMQHGLIPGQTPDADVVNWVLGAKGDAAQCVDKATFVPNRKLLLVAEFALSTSWFWVSIMFLRITFFPEWAKLFRQNFKRMLSKGRCKDNRSSTGSSQRSEFRIHLHTPSKDWIDLKNKSENSYSLRRHQLSGTGVSGGLHPPTHSRTGSQVAILSDPDRPGSGRPGSSRPDTAMSNSTATKDISKKVSVDDILAMRRLESRSQQGIREYPGVQPTKITRLTGEDEAVWPAYQLGQDDWSRERL